MRASLILLVLAAPAAARETVLVPIEDSTRFNLIAFLPLGLAKDAPGQVQWSHLIEHLIVTATGPLPFDEVNAETLGDWMHLDYTRPAGTWREGVMKLGRWLGDTTFEEGAIRREIGRVAAEAEQVAADRATQKFALAAWAHGVRHGATRVSVNGDLAKATPEALRLAARSSRPPVVAVSGRFERDAVLEALGAIELPKPHAPPPDERVEPPERVAWDLPTSHDVLYLPLPATTPRERALLAGVAPVLRMGWLPPPLLETDLDAGGRRWFVAVLPPGMPADVDAVRALLARLGTDPAWPRAVKAHLEARLASRPFVAPLMGDRDVAEAYAALEAGLHAFRYGDEAYAAALKDWDEAAVRRDVARLLDPKRLRLLRIVPE